jgi:hypothetical protein
MDNLPDPPLLPFLRAHPRLLITAVLAALVAMLGLVAFFGLQLQAAAHSQGGAPLEWAAFLGSLAACLGVLRAGAHLLDLSRSTGTEAESGKDGSGARILD